jgi:hypothetical protein
MHTFSYSDTLVKHVSYPQLKEYEQYSTETMPIQSITMESGIYKVVVAIDNALKP